MTVANTGAQPTGPMTLDQGVAHMASKLAERGAKAEDVVIPLEGEATEETGLVEETQDVETQQDENAEAVSEANQEADVEIPLSGKISMPDGSTITAEEARKGYLRQADFTRKTQALAQERDQIVAHTNAQMQRLEALIQQNASLQETEPNWLALAQDPNTDPKQLQAAQIYWQQKKAVEKQSRDELAMHRERTMQAQKAQAFEVLNSGKFDPAWVDPKVLKSALETVSNYLIERGLPGELIDTVTDPVLIEIAEESRRYRELQKAKPKAALAVQGKPKPFAPGAKSTASPQTETLRLLQEAFTKNPTPENAAALHKAKITRRG